MVPEWMKYFVDVPVLWLFFWMAKKFIERNILDPIQDAKRVGLRAERAGEGIMEKISDLKEKMSQDTQAMAKMFTECVSVSSHAEASVKSLENRVGLMEGDITKIKRRVIHT